MKIKPGMIAYIVRPWMKNEDIGRPVTVLRRAIRGQSILMRNGGVSRVDGAGEHNSWLCDASGGEFPCFIANECLRPLGGEGEEQETNVIARIPQAA
jgi:hypothetical protein